MDTVQEKRNRQLKMSLTESEWHALNLVSGAVEQERQEVLRLYTMKQIMDKAERIRAEHGSHGH